MEDTKLSADEIEQIIAQYKNENYNKQTIDLVREDLEWGLTKKQIDMYKSKKLRYDRMRAISNAMRRGIPDDLVARFCGGKYTEQQISIFTDEYVEGFDKDKLLEIIDSTQSGYDMKEACAKIRDKLSHTVERADEPEPEKLAEVDANEESESSDTDKQVAGNNVGTHEFLESVKLMMDTFSNTMQMQFDHMNKRDEEYRQAHDSEAEKILNDKISSLESALEDSRKDLSAASGVVSEKEQMIKSMQSDIDSRTKELSAKDDEIKKLREEMEQMKTGNIPISGSGSSAAVGSQVSSAVDSTSGQSMQSAVGDGRLPQATRNMAGSGVQSVAHTPNYTVNLTTANGNQIPLQVERTERKSSFGIGALMSKLLPKGPAKTILTRMIEGRYSGEQLSELEFAYSRGLDENEVNELIEANLPADEMHGIINVVAAAKGGEE